MTKLREAIARQRKAGGFVTLMGAPGVGRRHLVRATGAAGDGAAILKALDDPEALAQTLSSMPEHEPEIVALCFDGVPSAPTRETVAAQAEDRALVVISTTRWNHPAERVVSVDALDEAEAATMMRDALERAGGPTLGEEAGPSLGAVARFCDGRPRALLLAARQLTVLSAPQLARELRADPLGDHPLGRELRAAGDEALEGLDDDERRALSRLSVIGGTFDLDAARAVVGDRHPAIPTLLQSAAARSILEVEHDPEVPRYRLLTFAAECLRADAEPEELAAARVGSDAHYVSFGIDAGRLFERTADQRARRWLEHNREHFLDIRGRALAAEPVDRLSALLTTLLELQYLLLRGDAEERLRVIAETEDALRIVEEEGPLAIAHGWMSLARSDAAWILGRREASEEALAVAESLGASTGDPSLRARAAWRRGAYRYHWEGDVEGATAALEDAIVKHEAAGDELIAARARSTLGLVRLDAADVRTAKSVLLPALAVQERTKDSAWVGATRARIGHALALEGDLDAAEATIAEGEAELREANNLRLTLEPLALRALVARMGHRPEDALEHLSEALEIAATVRDDVQETMLRLDLAVALEELGELDASAKELDRTIALSRHLDMPHHHALALAHRARLDARQGHQPRQRLERARALLPAHRAPIDGPLLDVLAASTALLLGETPAAITPAPGPGLRLVLARRVLDAIAEGVVPTPALRIGQDALWFAPPHEGRIALDQKPLLRRILAALVDAAEADAGPLSLEALFEAGWPGERALPKSIKSRVWVAISTLRKLGLGDVLESVDGGYQLRKGVPRQRFDPV
jgi:tetratricopeptide (TPR) repeat protein